MQPPRGRPPGDRRARRLPARLARATSDRDAARDEALERRAAAIAELGVPVFLYGELARRARARRARLLPQRRPRRAAGCGWRRASCAPTSGPTLPHPTAGATLVTARPPLAAFNVELDSGDVEVARAVAAGLREAGGGLPGVRAIGLSLAGGRAQVSTNVHDPLAVPLGEVVERVRELAAPLGARAGRGGAGRPGPRGGARRLPGGRADARLRPRAARDRAAARPAASRLDSSHGPDQEEAPPQAPRHPGRARRHQRPRARPRSREEAKRAGRIAGGKTQPPASADRPADLAQRDHPRRRRARGSSRPAAAPLQAPARRGARARAPSCSSSTSRPATTSTRSCGAGGEQQRGSRSARARPAAMPRAWTCDAHGRPGGRELLPAPPRGLRPRRWSSTPARRPSGSWPRSRRSGSRSRRSCSPTATSTTSAPSRRWRRRPARPSTAPRSRCRCSPTSCPSSPGPASAPTRATTPTRP